MVALLLSVWVSFTPCGLDYSDSSEFSEQFAPAPTFKRFTLRRAAVVSLVDVKQAPGSLDCTILIMANGDRIHVIGTFEDIKRKVMGGDE